MGEQWLSWLRGDPRPWLLDPEWPAVRQLALRWLEDRDAHDPAVLAARTAAAAVPPVARILQAQDPEGWWVKPGPGYAPKYTGTVWSLIFLEQMGADPGDPRIQAGCDYVLAHVPASSGGFGCSGSHRADLPPPPSSVLHCLHGNLLRALIAFGRLHQPRVAAAVDWQVSAILGGPEAPRYYASGTSGPAFACGINEGLPCAWGAIKALRALTAIPADERGPGVDAAIASGVDLLLSIDPAGAAYPAGWGGGVSRAWFKLGFPSGYVADILQTGEVLLEAGHARDPRLSGLVQRILAKQDGTGRWRNEYPYRGRLWSDVDQPGKASPWVTLRACRFLRATLG